MKTTVVLVVLCLVFTAAEKNEKSTGGGKANARFLDFHGGGQHGITSGHGIHQGVGISGHHAAGIGGYPGVGGSTHLGLGSAGFSGHSSFGLGGLGVHGSVLGGQGLGGHGLGGHGLGGPGLGGIGGYPSPVAPPSTCRYWCRTPQNQAYCCEDSSQIPSFAGVVKPGVCPAVRPICPSTRSFHPPASCSNDGGCGGYDKCCFDTCLHQHVCKPPIQFG